VTEVTTFSILLKNRGGMQIKSDIKKKSRDLPALTVFAVLIV
jgi:hypothetical protein